MKKDTIRSNLYKVNLKPHFKGNRILCVASGNQ